MTCDSDSIAAVTLCSAKEAECKSYEAEGGPDTYMRQTIVGSYSVVWTARGHV